MTILPDLTKRVDEARMALLALCDTLAVLTPSPVAPPAGKYVPAVGDFVTWGSCTAMWRVLRVDSGGVYAVFAEKRNYTSEPRYLDPRECETLRLATPSELAAAGLAVPPPAPTPAPECPTCESPKRTDHRMVGNINDRYFCRDKWHAPTPAPEAKRPTLADVERSAEAFANHKGDIPHSPSDAWMDGWLARDRAVAHDGIAHSTNAPCPPPVASNPKRDEAVRGLVAFAARVSDTLRLDGTKRNADLVTEAGRLVALAREAGLCEGGSK